MAFIASKLSKSISSSPKCENVAGKTANLYEKNPKMVHPKQWSAPKCCAARYQKYATTDIRTGVLPITIFAIF